MTLAVTAVVLVASAMAAPAASALPTTIRTGGPSAPGEPKVAIVAADRQLGGDRFTVTRRGHVVLRGHSERPGDWPAAPFRKHAFEAALSG